MKQNASPKLVSISEHKMRSCVFRVVWLLGGEIRERKVMQLVFHKANVSRELAFFLRLSLLSFNR